MRIFVMLCLSSLLALASFSAVAAGDTPSALLGTWIEHGQNGAMRWVLAADRISVGPVDPLGKALADPIQIDVLYKQSGDGYALVARAPDGAALDEGRVQFKDGILLLELPGIGMHEMMRAKN
ncbi:hypothetical protein [Hydrocarboniphaga sp.]|uniref:hypothetical protein n=1 Tax=Hydrocarboniphaga sp. TaxID=2033016 RepID=UPI003D1169A8